MAMVEVGGAFNSYGGITSWVDYRLDGLCFVRNFGATNLEGHISNRTINRVGNNQANDIDEFAIVLLGGVDPLANQNHYKSSRHVWGPVNAPGGILVPEIPVGMEWAYLDGTGLHLAAGSGITVGGQPIATGGGATISDVAPTAPTPGTLWFDSANLKLAIWYDDGTSQQWIAI